MRNRVHVICSLMILPVVSVILVVSLILVLPVMLVMFNVLVTAITAITGTRIYCHRCGGARRGDDREDLVIYEGSIWRTSELLPRFQPVLPMRSHKPGIEIRRCHNTSGNQPLYRSKHDFRIFFIM